MKAAILAVGDELLAPGRAETNSVFLTDELAKMGIPVVFRAVVGDDESAIEALLHRTLLGADVVFLTGGLGPTADDVTRDATARALSREMELDGDWLERIQKRFDRRGIVMPEVNRKQAMVPRGADLLPNRGGTASGLWIRVDGDKAVVLLPGPPVELRAMFEAEVEPRLSQQAGDVVYDVRKLWVTGLAESAVEQRVCETYLRYKNPATTILASAGQVELRLTATGTNKCAAVAANDLLVAELRALLGNHLFSECEEELEEVVGQLLVSQEKRIAVAESLTGGLIACRLTDIPGASAYFDEGFVTYSNEAKTSVLEVPALLFESVGAVSEEVARAMAAGARARTGADLAVAATGIAGPSGASETKSVGLVYIGLASSDGLRVEKYQFPGTRRQVKRWTSQAALNLVRLELLEH
ncbi:MAG: competence/damage-inducible protein A [Acidobacteria bacterium]|nr:MAG: competence/damage-inducible protein A [Acidobacteriota bacterium]